MNFFLKETRKLLNTTDNICIILCNESCDLDSAVCSLSLAYFYFKNPDKFPNNRRVCNFLPILNIPKNEFFLKTEVAHFFKQNCITLEWITFKDEIDESFLKNSAIVLVDHHFSPYSHLAVAIFDHRPVDSSAKISEICHKIIEPVGSCSTLIGNMFLQLTDVKDHLEPLNLLYAAIILDTVNFSKEADKAKPLDLEVAKKIENLLRIQNVEEHRYKLLQELIKARADISALDSYQILFKDMKLVVSKSGNVRIAFPGYPILVFDYIQMQDAERSIKRFANIQNCSSILLIGFKVTDNVVERDVGVININNNKLFSDILEKLKYYNNPSLELVEYENCSFLGGKFFIQKNIKVSRKQILPIVKSILDEL